MEELYIDIYTRKIENKEIYEIKIDKNIDDDLLYKILIGREGVWEALDDEFSRKDEFQWTPLKKGNYHILAQAKKVGSAKSFDYKVTRSVSVGVNEESLIQDIFINKEVYDIGDKVEIMVESNIKPVMYRYFISSKEGWRLMRDYTPDNTLNFTANEAGSFDVLVECKIPDSDNNFDDYNTINFVVNNIENVEIVDFKCLASELLVGEELIFKVMANFEDDRTGLYKFVKVKPDGTAICVQDYSSRNMVAFTEDKSGSYKLMCYIRDMYSAKDFDDRALMNYKIKPYKDLKIKSITTDLTSPETVGENINIRAIVSGGKNVKFRFIVDGPYTEDSGYTRSSSFMWNTKKPGNYVIKLFARDESYVPVGDKDYEVTASINFTVEEDLYKPVRITKINANNGDIHIVDKPVKISVATDGGSSIKYAFDILKMGEVVKTKPYGDENFIEFTPDEAGLYDIDVKVKDKYSEKPFDNHNLIHVDVKAYRKAKIDHVLVPAKDYFLVGDNIDIEAIVQNTRETLMRYVTTINGQIVEETEFGQVEKLAVFPKCPGKYVVEIYVKNKKCKIGFDNKREIKFFVNEAPPVTNTMVMTDKTVYKLNEEINFVASSNGGKGVCYEFYVMTSDSWNLVQKYSRKKYYAFRPFLEGNYKVLVLAKSHYRKCAYEDYGVLEFKVEE
ncbi:MAG: triple tyrosine motif-containing protein [Sarcina sp.]